jgi:2-oxoglutarate dehydrogenase E2 component (dihydrolipoamide succinyltransferase)
MAVEVRIPELGESVTEGVIVRWLKGSGDPVEAGEPLLELETDKATMEVTAEAAGRVEVVEPEGGRVRVGSLVARNDEAATDGARAPAAAAREAEGAQEPSPEPAVRSAPSPPSPEAAAPVPAPAPAAVSGVAEPAPAPPPRPVRPAAPPPADAGRSGTRDGDRAAPDEVERVAMSELRRTIARRLVEAQRTAAILTTFNEIDLGELLALRARQRERFRARHGVDLGLTSLFARAAVLALHAHPVVNASIDGDEIVYHRRVHLGIAVSTSRGLVVPVVRDADGRSVADLESAIAGLAQRARDGRLAPGDLAGGTFTITNGGVFGSMLSTPILNPPQAAILGMHAITDRPVAREGRVVVRPVMYVALSYDHRLVDGEQAVTFLVRVKGLLEDPARMALEV